MMLSRCLRRGATAANPRVLSCYASAMLHLPLADGASGSQKEFSVSYIDTISSCLRSKANISTSAVSQWADLQVKVPPLGESITDGSIAAILKSEGDQVEEDDPLIQIETDKVTVDVRSPVAGIVKSILVRADDTVEVDHVVAVIEEGEAAGRAEVRESTKSVPIIPIVPKDATKSSAETPKEQAPPVHMAEDTSSVLQGNRAHRPRISFPKRRTRDGRVISDLDKEEQMRIRNDEIAAKHSMKFFMKRQTIERPPLPPRRDLSDKEMEMIMLGGAE